MDPNSAEARAGLRFHGFGREKWDEVENKRAVMVYWGWARGMSWETIWFRVQSDAGKAHQRSLIDERSQACRLKDKNVGEEKRVQEGHAFCGCI